jgi:uncharacterized repeat protein (TIGR01451 family)
LRIVCRSAVTIDKSVSDKDKVVAVGDEVTYDLVVTNNGPEPATNVMVDDPVPGALDAKSASTLQGTCTVTANRVGCSLGTLAVGQSVRIEVRADAKRTGGTTNTATVTSAECTVTPCDEDPAKVKILEPKLKLKKKVNKQRVEPGGLVRYTLIVRNVSKVDARKARVCDNLAEQTSLVSLGGGELDNGKLCWDLGTVKAGKKVKVSFTARVDRDADAGRMPNVATLNWDGGKDRDREVIKVPEGDIEGISEVTGKR